MHTLAVCKSSRISQQIIWCRRWYRSPIRPLPGYTTARLELESCIRSAVASEFALINEDQLDVGVLRSKMGHGDYQTSFALSMARMVKLPPIAVADRIIASINKSGIIADVSVTGIGFINIRLGDRYLLSRIRAMCADTATGRLGMPKVAKSLSKKIVVDFSSPNIAKEMHVGHLRSTIIGDCISRAFEFLGHDVLRLNHVGDWGTQFGMLIHFLKLNHPQVCDEILRDGHEVRGAAIGEIAVFYKLARKAFEENVDNFQDRSRAEVVSLQNMDPSSLSLWKFFCNLSRQEFQKNYATLDVRLIERGESFYNPLLHELVDGLLQSGIAIKSNGAVVVSDTEPAKISKRSQDKKSKTIQTASEEEGSQAIVLQKSDGGFLYATTDLAALKYRLSKPKGIGKYGENGAFAERGDGDGADALYYVTDAGQALHFGRLFSVAEKCGIPISNETLLKHVPFGVVLGEDGKKLKSRSGDTVRLSDLLDDAVRHAELVLQDRDRNANDSTLKSRAIKLGIASVKYADLSVKRETEYRFSPSKMTSLSGNTAPYLMYAFVRIRGVRRKIESHVEGNLSQKLMLDIAGEEKFYGINAAERNLASKLASFDEVLLDFAGDLYPHKICDYLFDLCHLFNIFYETCPVLKAENENERAWRFALCIVTEDVLRMYFDILGIGTIDDM